MYYITFRVPSGDCYTARCRARTAKYAIHLIIRGKRTLVAVRLTPPCEGNVLERLGTFA